MINGAHVIIYSTNAEADRAFFRDVIGFDYVDAGQGWLIFALPRAEIAVHPGERNNHHEFYLMCSDLPEMTRQLHGQGIATSPVHEEPWGSLIELTLPGGGRLGLYQPKHLRPPS